MIGHRLDMLRRVSPDRLHLDAVVHELVQHGIAFRWAGVDPAKSYLKFTCPGAQGDSAAFIDLQSWVRVRLPAMADLGWSPAHDALASEIFASVPSPLNFAQGPLDTAQWKFNGIVRLTRAAELPAVVSMEGDVLIDGPLPLKYLAPPATAYAADWGVMLGFRLGRATIGANTLARARSGDVMLLRDLRMVACIEGRPIFSFSYSKDALIVDELLDSSYNDIDDTSDIAAATLNMDGLGVTVDVVLARLPAPLRDLAGLQSGTVFELPEQAHMSVRLEVAGQLIGIGELVQAGDRLGVSISRLGRS